MPYHPHPHIIICTSFISSIDYSVFIVLQCSLKDHLCRKVTWSNDSLLQHSTCPSHSSEVYLSSYSTAVCLDVCGTWQCDTVQRCCVPVICLRCVCVWRREGGGVLWQHMVTIIQGFLLCYRNIQCLIVAMPFIMILIMYVIPCNLSCDFSKLTVLYIYMYMYSIIFMTNTSLKTFLYVNEISVFLSVCMSVCRTFHYYTIQESSTKNLSDIIQKDSTYVRQALPTRQWPPLPSIAALLSWDPLKASPFTAMWFVMHFVLCVRGPSLQWHLHTRVYLLYHNSCRKGYLPLFTVADTALIPKSTSWQIVLHPFIASVIIYVNEDST